MREQADPMQFDAGNTAMATRRARSVDGGNHVASKVTGYVRNVGRVFRALCAREPNAGTHATATR
jgi:hypothetical protein